MKPDTVLQWALLAAQAAMKIIDQIDDDEVKRAVAAETRKMLTDQNVLLRAEMQQLLDERNRKG